MVARKARIEGEAVLEPKPGDNADALERFTEYFKQKFPDDWEVLKLCPLQHGLEAMIEKLKH